MSSNAYCLLRCSSAFDGAFVGLSSAHSSYKNWFKNKLDVWHIFLSLHRNLCSNSNWLRRNSNSSSHGIMIHLLSGFFSSFGVIFNHLWTLNFLVTTRRFIISMKNTTVIKTEVLALGLGTCLNRQLAGVVIKTLCVDPWISTVWQSREITTKAFGRTFNDFL